MKLFLLNSRSINNKLNQFQNFVYSNKVDIFCVTETWLTDAIYDNEILPTDYSVYRNDRNSRGGGVMIVINNNICSELIPSNSDLEVLSIKIKIKPISFTVCVVYIPPNSDVTSYDSLSTYLIELSTDNSPIIIAGDFNRPDIN